MGDRDRWMSLAALLVIATLALGMLACGSQTSPKAASASSTARPPQDDDHISTYGHEAGEPQRRVIASLVRRYYAAAAAGDGAAGCAMIDPRLAEDVPRDYYEAAGLPAKSGRSCAYVLSRIFKRLPGQPPSALARTRVTGIRLGRESGFVQLSSPTMATGEIVVGLSAGAWKLDVLVGRPCRRCAAH